METTYTVNIKCPYCGHENAYKGEVCTMNDDDLSVPCQLCGKMIEPRKKPDIPEAVLACVTEALMRERDGVPGTIEDICREIGRVVLTAAHYAEMVEENEQMRKALREIDAACDATIDYFTTGGQKVACAPRINLTAAKDIKRLYLAPVRTALKKAGVKV